jgi:hypothetical protein
MHNQMNVLIVAFTLSLLCSTAAAVEHIYTDSLRNSIVISSPIMKSFVSGQGTATPIHVVFFISRPRAFIYGEALVAKTISQLQTLGFDGTITVVVRGRRYYADIEYVRRQRWLASVYIDTSGRLLEAARIKPIHNPHFTVWDTSGTCLYRHVLGTSTLDMTSLERILRECRNGARKSVELDALADPLPEKSSALTVGYETPDKKWRIPKRISSIALQDDSVICVGSVRDPVLSSDGRWLAVMDQTYFYVRIYDLMNGHHHAIIKGDTSVCYKLSWWYPDTISAQAKRMLIAQAQFPYFVDTTLYVHHLYGYIHNADIGPSQYLGINKESYLLKYEPPFYRITGGTKLQLSPYVGECTDCFCLSGIYHPGSGYVVAGDMVCYPFHRGYPSVSGDTSPPANNPRADEFYHYAPLYGAFNLSTGWHTGKTFGTLNRQISHHYATGYLYNTIRSFACRNDGSLCAWIQWLDTCLELSNGKRIPLKYYWTETMLRPASPEPTPTANHYTALYDSAGATIQRLWIADTVCYVLWKVKKRGYPLDGDVCYAILQQYHLTNASFNGEWSLPANIESGQTIVNAIPATFGNRVAVLYQGPTATTLVWYALE